MNIPEDQLTNQSPRRTIQDAIGLGGQFANYSQSPIKVFTVWTTADRCMAFLGSDPSKRETAGSRMEAVAALLEAQKLIVVTEIDK